MTEIASLRASIEMDSSRFNAGVQSASKASDNLAERLVRLASGHDRFILAQERAGSALAGMAAKAQSAVDTFARIKAATDSAAESARGFQEAFDAADEVDRLRASLDPVYAATKRYEAAVKSVQNALDRNAVSQKQANTVLSLAKQRFDAATGAAVRFDAVSETVQGSAGNFRGAVQNVSFQLQDLAVQIGSGTSAAVALGQQLPQLLGGFGAVGAAIGLVAAVAVPLGARFLNIGGNAADTSEAIDAFSAALDRANAAAEIAGTSVRELAETYGDAAASIQENARYAAQSAVQDAARSVEALVGPLRGGFNEAILALDDLRSAEQRLFEARDARTADPQFGPSVDQIQTLVEQTEAFEDALNEALGPLGLTRTNVAAIALAFSEFKGAETLEDMTREAQEGLDVIRQFYPAGSELPAVLGESVALFERIVREGAATVEVLEDAGISAGEVAGSGVDTTMSTAATEAGKFSDFLRDAHGWAQRVAGEMRDASMSARLGYQGSRIAGQSQGLSGESGALLDRIIGVESGGNASARNPNSSATGLGQFIESTWLRLFRENFPDRAEGMSRAAILALREDASTSRAMVDLYIQENRDILARAGVAVTDANLYLAHFLGPGGAIAVNRAPGAAVADTLDASAIAANPTILGGGVTGQDVIAWAQEKVGVGVPAVEAMEAAVAAEASALKESTQAAEEAQRSLDSLTASLDPAAKASIDLANMQAKVDAAVQGGAMSAAEGAQMMADFRDALDARTAEQQAEELEKVQGALDGIVGSLDPATQASLEFAEAQKAVAAAVQAGIISAARGQQILDDLTMQQIMNTEEMKDVIAAQERAAEEVKSIWEGATQSISDYFADGLMNGFEDGIEGAIDILKDGLRQMIAMALRNRIFIPIQTGIQAGLSGGALPGAGPGSGMLGGIGSAIGSFMGSVGAGMGSVVSGFMTGGFAGAGTAITTAMGGATASMAGFAAAAGAIAVPLLAAAAVFLAFRKKVKVLDEGIRVTIDGYDALIETFKKTKTTRLFGLVSNTRTNFEEAAPDVANPIIDAYRDVYDSVADMAGQLGIGADAFKDFSYEFKLSLKGMTDEQKQAALAAEFQKVADALATTAGVTAQFIRVGETAGQALQRMTTSLTAANGAMAALGFDLFDVSMKGADAASAFVELFGSLDQFTTAMEFYHTNFYSLAERAQEASRQFRAGLDEIGLNIIPQTEKVFRAMVDSLMEQGRTKDAAELIQLAPLFQQMLGLREEANGMAGDAARGVSADGFTTRFGYQWAQATAAQRAIAPRLSEGERQIVVSLEAVRQEQARMREEQRQLQTQVATNTRHTVRALTDAALASG